MRLSIRKIISTNPWLLPIGLFVSFALFWGWFISFAVRHSPQVVPLVTVEAQTTNRH